jgi:hypothetical protein
MAPTAQFDTVSEEYFAAYLDEAKHRWERHPRIPGQTKTPDFVFPHDGVQVFSEVKERTPNNEQLDAERTRLDAIAAGGPHISVARFFDPVDQVRRLINEGRRKFKDFDGYLCVLIISNNGHPDMRLDPIAIFGAMLGNPGFEVGLNVRTGVADAGSTRSVFLPRGGSMIRNYRPLTPSKSLRNVSAVVALESYRLPNPLFEHEFNEEMVRQTERFEGAMTREQELALREEVRVGLIFDRGLHMTIGDAWGLTVCTNPFGSIPFPKNLFNGPFDERWSVVDGEVTRLFSGEHRRALDRADDEGEEL